VDRIIGSGEDALRMQLHGVRTQQMVIRNSVDFGMAALLKHSIPGDFIWSVLPKVQIAWRCGVYGVRLAGDDTRRD